MYFTVIDKSARQREDLDYSLVIVKLIAVDVFDMDRALDAGLVMKTLLKGSIVKIIVDMTDLQFIDSQGIGVIINTAKLIRSANGDLVMIHVGEIIQSVLRPLNFQKFVKMFDNEEDAVNYLKFI